MFSTPLNGSVPESDEWVKSRATLHHDFELMAVDGVDFQAVSTRGNRTARARRGQRDRRAYPHLRRYSCVTWFEGVVGVVIGECRLGQCRQRLRVPLFDNSVIVIEEFGSNDVRWLLRRARIQIGREAHRAIRKQLARD